MTKLEQAIQKLEHIRNDQEATQKAIRFDHDQIPIGQPNIIGRPDIYKKLIKTLLLDDVAEKV